MDKNDAKGFGLQAYIIYRVWLEKDCVFFSWEIESACK